MEVHLANALKCIENPHPRQYFGREDGYRGNQQSNRQQTENQTTRCCYKCDKPGHFTNECMLERKRTTPTRSNQLNAIEICSDSEWYTDRMDESEEEEDDEHLYRELYPVEKRSTGCPKKQPYIRP